MHLLAYDYFADRPDSGIGLISLVDGIADLRSEENVTTLLFDNGDALQGNPLADYLALQPEQTTTHPMIAAFNSLRYDAMTLGNHEFDFGIPFLRTALNGADFPVVSANIRPMSGSALAQPFVVLERQVICDDGVTRHIKVGVTGFAPPQTADWFQAQDGMGLLADDIIEAANTVVPKIKAAGADVIIALCHAGIVDEAHYPRMENAALPLSEVTGIDVILLGHTHSSFPDDSLAGSAAIDPALGTIHQKPAVMAAFYGKALGVVDLTLEWSKNGWAVSDHAVRLAQASYEYPAPSPLAQQISQIAAVPHAAALARIRQPIAQAAIPVQNYFTTIQPDLAQQLLARATRQAVISALADTEHAQIPVLAAKSPFHYGGHSGFGHYIDIPVGPITLRDAAAIFPFADKLCALRRTGAQIAQWLERSVAYYHQISAGQHDQALINPQSAGYNCDTLYGLRYEIDISQPAQFDPEGREINPDARRIKHLSCDGKPVQPDDIFIVATTSYRANGGGGFVQDPANDILFVSGTKTYDILVDYLQSLGDVTEPVQPIWSFSPIPDSSATFQSAQKAAAYLPEGISCVGRGTGKHDTYRITF